MSMSKFQFSRRNGKGIKENSSEQCIVCAMKLLVVMKTIKKSKSKNPLVFAGHLLCP
jgi:hypothetical protein